METLEAQNQHPATNTNRIASNAMLLQRLSPARGCPLPYYQTHRLHSPYFFIFVDRHAFRYPCHRDIAADTPPHAPRCLLLDHPVRSSSCFLMSFFVT